MTGSEPVLIYFIFSFEECEKHQLWCIADPLHHSCKRCRTKKLWCTNTGEERRVNKRREAKKAKEGKSKGDWTAGRVRLGSRVARRPPGRSTHRTNDGYE